jgi:hypothetical protein
MWKVQSCQFVLAVPNEHQSLLFTRRSDLRQPSAVAAVLTPAVVKLAPLSFAPFFFVVITITPFAALDP